MQQLLFLHQFGFSAIFWQKITYQLLNDFKTSNIPDNSEIYLFGFRPLW